MGGIRGSGQSAFPRPSGETQTICFWSILLEGSDDFPLKTNMMLQSAGPYLGGSDETYDFGACYGRER